MSKRNFKASAQGSLDGLCGIYSIINACDLMLGGKLDYDYRSKLFCKLTNLLDDGRPIGDIIFDGIDFRAIGKLIDVASRTLALDHKVAIERTVAWKSKKGQLARFWADLSNYVAPAEGRTAILGLEGKHYHWTVIERVTENQLKLADSDELSRLNKANCSLDETKIHQLLPTQTYLLKSYPVEDVDV
ncbi:hypothetical protein [Phaeobacter gallaeciensis]|uniref:hypothetical protein n=1 Tax=Phaeobacter gallaeciensis TaxID=60890 RepID=UPI000BBC1420|nr:hypothetical protein [Phaeobacter gallaeciensis]ATF16813.1 hypothetical protein PhaeoP129_00143 [Phaeobacter gallaeciensis]ATF20922.1 hypothetical protein PhaeoP128_00143 [Phaeobacter gallaeciensis]